ncbi:MULTISPECIES: ATPase, T2SS/T4P/T4SS family [unclassified Microbacterium]|uniref:ATPase, T2SS/T4P/T4SS family n=1 Tax=unclassified Microbacterium TaxID=2609290 RepID=UPI000CFDE39B|nr:MULTISPECIES: ATPase, T2SS/T4P/T4SS family [unclassified Microbacterium]PQZ53187.1 hypothetical protein CQ032_15910 [Microbacterium sp. MYb43]PQZ74729.1 hypothetical protein CQ031_15255 [Microbacterium sp. MYb40]PRB18817.1 hypothetical protein CQ040_16560 [Microbacterium sp. MYb54]PRB23677.1 hypothetical protein CQ037_17360 [Microbacterium sp. MYb50]PRB63315.1 hypothetical protein CQ021_16545 [Microbacterium sp. MYb24]
MPDIPDVQITTQPFFDDMLGATAAAPPAANDRVRGNSHLFSAATGQPSLHLVGENESSAAAPVVADPTESLRNRRRRPDRITPAGYLNVDWDIVQMLTKQLEVDTESQERTRADFDVVDASADPETDAEERTMEEIDRVIERHVVSIAQQRGTDFEWSPLEKAHYAQAIFDQAHRYGRLQQYLREPDVEDISIVGHDNVVVWKTNGLCERRPPIATNDDELQQLIADIASYRGRSFARPGGKLSLDIGGGRVSATGRGITSVTNMTVRKHGLVDVELADMVKRGTINLEMAEFLTAASNANLCVLVAGFPGAGKTTFVRAMLANIPPHEKISTIETERELYLNKLPHRHWQTQDLQYVPPQSAGADSEAGTSLQECLDMALRAKSERIVFAEILNDEATVAMKAMKAGKGSTSTIHAVSADDAIHRFADVLMSQLGLSDDTVPLRQIMRSIHLIIYIDFVEKADGTRDRIVTEITEVRGNDRHEPMAARLFYFDPDLRRYTQPEKPSEQLDARLRRVGYDYTDHWANS